MSLRRPVVATVAAVVMVLVCAAALVGAWRAHADDELLDRNRADVAVQAGPLVAQLFSSDAAQDDGRAPARAAVTAEFAQQYADLLDTSPPPGVSITWAPVHTGIAEVSAEHAEVVVSALVTERAPGAEATEATKVVDVRLERTGGQWKIARADEVL